MTRGALRAIYEGMARRKPATPKRKIDPRAAASGLGPKLQAFFAAVTRAHGAFDERWGAGLPENPSQLADWLTEKKEKPVTKFATSKWTLGHNLPESWFVPELEELLGAFWWWILDPETTWKREGPMATVYTKTRALTDAELRAVVERLDALPAAVASRAPRR